MALLARSASVVVAISAAVAACGGAEEKDGGAPRPEVLASCAAQLVWDGATYLGSGVRLPAQIGEPLGRATRPACGPADEDETVAVSRIQGVEPRLAIATPDSPLTVWVAETARAEDHPPALERILLGPSCDASEPFTLAGIWVGESNLDEPFSVHLQVDDAEGAGRSYLGLVLDVAVRDSTTGMNARGDFSSRQFGRVRIRAKVRCVDADKPNRTFLAERIVEATGSEPPSFPTLLCSPIKESPPCTNADVGVGYPFDLYTHCGIEYAYFDGRYWLAEPPLNDGSGNPPHGWNNPFQRGLMRLLSPEVAEFRTADLMLRFEPAPESYLPPGCA